MAEPTEPTQPQPTSREEWERYAPSPNPGSGIYSPEIVTVAASRVANSRTPMVAYYVEGLGRFVLAASHARALAVQTIIVSADAENDCALEGLLEDNGAPPDAREQYQRGVDAYLGVIRAAGETATIEQLVKPPTDETTDETAKADEDARGREKCPTCGGEGYEGNPGDRIRPPCYACGGSGFMEED